MLSCVENLIRLLSSSNHHRIGPFSPLDLARPKFRRLKSHCAFFGTSRKHTLNCHRMKPALFSVLCDIKEKTGEFLPFFPQCFDRNRLLSLSGYGRRHVLCFGLGLPKPAPPSDVVAAAKAATAESASTARNSALETRIFLVRRGSSLRANDFVERFESSCSSSAL